MQEYAQSIKKIFVNNNIDFTHITNVSPEKLESGETSLLENHTILCDIRRQGIGIKARQLKNKEETLQYVAEKIKDGSVININQETGINDRNLWDLDR